MDVLFCDFETRSTVDLRKCGADVYVRDENTRVMAFGYAFNDGPIQIVKLGERPPFEIEVHIAQGKPVVAHNAVFEWAVWNHVYVREFPMLPKLEFSQLDCTMNMAYAMSLPGSLDKAAAAMGLDVSKDAKGQRVMMQLCKPKEDVPLVWYTPESHPEKFEQMYNYCAQDIEIERQLYKRLVKLSPSEKKTVILDHKINQRGVGISIQAVKVAMKLVEIEKQRLDREMKKITGNVVGTCSEAKRLTDWVLSQGIELEGVAKSDVTELLRKEDLPDHVRKALLLRQAAAKSSNANLYRWLKVCAATGELVVCSSTTGQAPDAGVGEEYNCKIYPGQIHPNILYPMFFVF